METIGAYAFVTRDWKEKGYPLDLWLKWHFGLFDKISIVTYGKFKVPFHNNKKLIVTPIKPVSKDRFSFYVIGKTLAQHNLDTDWKVILDIDEFFADRINVTGFDKSKAYAIRFHQLYGNINTEMISAEHFAENKFVIHYGNREITNDSAGAGVAPPYAARPLIINSIRTELNKRFNIGKRAYRFYPRIYFDLYHTNTLRDPKILAKKMKEDILREKNEGVKTRSHLLKVLGKKIDYRDYKKFAPKSYLVRVKDENLPKVLIKNKNRLNWVEFPFHSYGLPWYFRLSATLQKI